MELSAYLSLFPGASRGKARLMALAETVLRQALDLVPLVRSVPAAYSFSSAEGVQLDAISEALGLNRDPGMSDADFRQYLLEKLLLWTWDGTNEGVPAVLPQGVTESDNGDGTVSVSPSGTRMDVLPVPAGIRATT